MLNFEHLVEDLSKNENDPKTYLFQFFTKENFNSYQIETIVDKNELKAIKTMFVSKKDLLERVSLANKYDPFCIEAFFVYFLLSEDVYVNYRFESFYDQLNYYGDLSIHQKYCFNRIMDFYIEFLIDIHNYSKAIKVLKMMIKLRTPHNLEIQLLSSLYYEIENSDEFYRLYLNSELNEYSYLLLIVTLLKNDEEFKAKQVLEDMFNKYEYSRYLDHLWDLDMENDSHKRFYKIVEDNYQELASVPDFFSWVNRISQNTI